MSSRYFVLECKIDLPTDGFEQAEIIAKVKAPWDALKEAVTSIGGQNKAEIIEARPKPVTYTYTGQKRGRKPKSYPVAVTNPDEAAD